MKQIEFNNLDNSLSSFQLIKRLSEHHWTKVNLIHNCWGLQVQRDSKWRKGLTEDELEDFQSRLGFRFPESLKNFYRTMNGLNTYGIDLRGGEEETTFERMHYYQYPEDIVLIKELIHQNLKANDFNENDILSKKIPGIFPYFGNRYLVFDKNNQVLSIHGNDIIYWGENLPKALIKDIFQIFIDITLKDLSKYKKVSGWLEE